MSKALLGNNSVAIVLGLGNPGAFVFKSLQGARDLPLYGLGRKGESGLKKVRGNISLWHPAFDLEEWVSSLENKHRAAPVLFLCSGFMISYILENCPRILEKYQTTSPPLDLLQKLNSKDSAAALLRKMGVKTIKGYLPREVEKIPESEFPIIVKWGETEVAKGDAHSKAFIVKTPEELRTLQLSERRILQPFIADSVQFSYAGYFENGRERAGVGVLQKRMYPKGASTFVRTLKENEEAFQTIKTITEKIVTALDYSGFGEFEFLYDAKSSTYFLLEINPRTWGWMGIFKMWEKDFAKIFYGQSISGFYPAGPFYWINLPRLVAGNLLLDFPKQFFSTLSILFGSLLKVEKIKVEWLP